MMIVNGRRPQSLMIIRAIDSNKVIYGTAAAAAY